MKLKKIACSILLAVLLVSCAPGENLAQQKTTLRFAYDYWAGYYPALIAIEKGYFAEDNLNVIAVKPENTDALMADFLAGKYDLMAVSLGDTITLTQTSDDIYFILASDESAGGDAVVVKPEINSIQDLRGKQIGTNIGGFGELFITTVLKNNGINPSEVNFVNMDAAEGPAKLLSGELQAVHTWEPYVTQARTGGNKVLFSSADTPGLILDGIIVRGDVINRNPEAVRAFVKNWFKAVELWKTNPQEGNQAAANQLGVDASEISLEGIKLHDFASNQLLFDPNSPISAYATANLYVDFFIANGSLRTKPDINKLLNSQFVKQ